MIVCACRPFTLPSFFPHHLGARKRSVYRSADLLRIYKLAKSSAGVPKGVRWRRKDCYIGNMIRDGRAYLRSQMWGGRLVGRGSERRFDIILRRKTTLCWMVECNCLFGNKRIQSWHTWRWIWASCYLSLAPKSQVWSVEMFCFFRDLSRTGEACLFKLYQPKPASFCLSEERKYGRDRLCSPSFRRLCLDLHKPGL